MPGGKNVSYMYENILPLQKMLSECSCHDIDKVIQTFVKYFKGLYVLHSSSHNYNLNLSGRCDISMAGVISLRQV